MKHPAKSSETSSIRRIFRTLPLLLLAASALLSYAARRVPGFSDAYGTHLYPLWEGSLGRFSGLFPFSLSEALLVLFPALLLLDLIRRRKRLRRFFFDLALLLSCLLFLYVLNCGINYYRTPFVSEEVYQEDLSDELLGEYLEYVASELQESSREAVSYPDWAETAASARTAMIRLGEYDPALKGFYPLPKRLHPLSRFFSMMGVSGIYSPFTIEANVNGEMPAMNNPFTACHELSHLRGYMNEGEANYIGWLACIRSEDPAFRRSGWLVAFQYAGRALRRADPERYAEVLNSLPADVILELQSNAEFWASRENRASEVQNQVNDAYLKQNGQSDGIRTYGRLTDLMLRYYQEELQHRPTEGQ